jgi:SAM-dependent methyltransferase
VSAAGPDWSASFFEGTALGLWRDAHTRDESRGQAHDLAAALALDVRRGGARVLDVPCGNGRVALELAALGMAVTGVDASATLLAEARVAAEARRLALELHQGDMRALAFEAAFDAAFCAGNSFGYFDDAGNAAFLAGVARALVRGGRFVLEYPLVAELVLARQSFKDWRVLGERLLLSDAWHDPATGRLETTYQFADLARGGDLETRSASYRVYGAHELTRVLEHAGFVAVELLADLAGTPFTPRSGELYVRATRA